MDRRISYCVGESMTKEELCDAAVLELTAIERGDSTVKLVSGDPLIGDVHFPQQQRLDIRRLQRRRRMGLHPSGFIPVGRRIEGLAGGGQERLRLHDETGKLPPAGRAVTQDLGLHGLAAASPEGPRSVGAFVCGRRTLPEHCEVGENVFDVLVAQRLIRKHAAPRMPFAYRSKPGLVIFQFQRRSITQIRSGSGQPCDDRIGFGLELGLPVDHPVEAVTVVANPLAIEESLPLRRITLHRGTLLVRLSPADVGCREQESDQNHFQEKESV